MNIRKMTRSVLGAAILAASTGAYALPSVTNLFSIGENDIWSDDSMEVLIDVGGGQPDGLVGTGDILLGMFTLTSYKSGGDVGDFKQLTALFATKIETASYAFTNGQGIDMWNYTFGPVGAGDAFDWNAANAISIATQNGLEILNIGPFTTPDGAIPAGTVALFFEDDTTFSNPLALEADVETYFDDATDGDVRIVVGQVGANGDSWSGLGPRVLTDFLTKLVPDQTPGGATFDFDLTVTADYFANVDVGPDIRNRNGVISRCGEDHPNIICDQTELVLDVAEVPAPATLGLMALGLLGIGSSTRRFLKNLVA